MAGPDESNIDWACCKKNLRRDTGIGGGEKGAKGLNEEDAN